MLTGVQEVWFARHYLPEPALILCLAVFYGRRMRDLALRSWREGTPLPHACHRLYRLWFACGVPAFASVLAIVWLMITKPVEHLPVAASSRDL